MDINLTWVILFEFFFNSKFKLFQYSENLLMHAIRYKNEKIAEFLIFKGINFNYEAKLMV